MKLDASKSVMGVKLAPRIDCCPEQGQNVKVQVGNSMAYDANDPVCITIDQLEGVSLKYYSCDNVYEGQYVILSNDNSHLTICEAQVLTS